MLSGFRFGSFAVCCKRNCHILSVVCSCSWKYIWSGVTDCKIVYRVAQEIDAKLMGRGTFWLGVTHQFFFKGCLQPSHQHQSILCLCLAMVRFTSNSSVSWHWIIMPFIYLVIMYCVAFISVKVCPGMYVSCMNKHVTLPLLSWKRPMIYSSWCLSKLLFCTLREKVLFCFIIINLFFCCFFSFVWKL